MNKKDKIKLISISGVILVITIVFCFLINIRNEFVQYLDTQYPEQSFKVGFTKIDIIYGNYYAKVNCLTDGTHFGISKQFNTKDIHTDYVQVKGTAQYNSKIKSIFDGNDIQKDIVDVIGGGKTPYENSGSYETISIRLISDTDQVADVKKVLNIFKEKNINVDRLSFTYEKDKNVYELSLSSNDYNLTEKEIELKFKKIK